MSLVSLDDYEEAAVKKIPKAVLEYYRGGAGNELSLQLNRSAFDRQVFNSKKKKYFRNNEQLNNLKDSHTPTSFTRCCRTRFVDQIFWIKTIDAH